MMKIILDIIAFAIVAILALILIIGLINMFKVLLVFFLICGTIVWALARVVENLSWFFFGK